MNFSTDSTIQRIRERFSEISIRKAVLYTVLWLLPFLLLLLFVGLSETLSRIRMESLAGFVIYMVPLALIYYAFRKKELSLKPILLYNGKHKKELIMVIPLMIFSFSIIWIAILLLNQLSPDFAQRYLDYITSVDFLTTSPETPIVDYLFIFVVIAVLPPIFEEVVFRGSFVERLGRKYSYKSAVIISSVIFGILHVDIVGAFMVGLILCLIYLKTLSLFIPIVIHAINNGLIVIFIFLDDQFFQFEHWDTIEPFLATGWIGVLMFITSSVWLGIYLKKNWYLVHKCEPVSQPGTLERNNPQDAPTDLN